MTHHDVPESFFFTTRNKEATNPPIWPTETSKCLKVYPVSNLLKHLSSNRWLDQRLTSTFTNKPFLFQRSDIHKGWRSTPGHLQLLPLHPFSYFSPPPLSASSPYSRFFHLPPHHTADIPTWPRPSPSSPASCRRSSPARCAWTCTATPTCFPAATTSARPAWTASSGKRSEAASAAQSAATATGVAPAFRKTSNSPTFLMTTVSGAEPPTQLPRL